MRDASAAAMKTLNAIKKISSQTDVENILNSLDGIIQTLPTLTVQKLLKIDETDLGSFADQEYRTLLENVTSKFDHTFPLNEGRIYEEIRRLFCVEDHNFFVVACDVIVTNLKTRELNVATTLSLLMEAVLKSEGCFDLVFHNFYSLRQESDFEREERQTQWESQVRMLMSVPNRVSNSLQGQFNDFFKADEYCKFLVFTILKLIELATDLLLHESEHEIYFDYGQLSLLLSKTLTDFHEHQQSEGIKSFIRIVAVLTNQKSQKQHLYQKLFWKVFESMERAAVEIFALMVLKNFDPTLFSIKNFLGRELVKNDNWKFVFCTKIPLLSCYEDDKLVNNLVVYLSAASDHSLFTLLVNLVTVWSDKSALNHTSVEQHLYITKMIVVIMNSMKNIGFSEHEARTIQEKMYAGVSIHLESNIHEIRASGMKASEIVLNFLNSESDNQAAALKFDYSTLPEGSKSVVEKLQTLYDNDMTIYFTNKIIDDNVAELISLLLVTRVENIPYTPPEQLKKSLEAPNNVIVAESIHKNNLITIIDSTDFELDSDDDLEPYDVSNDVQISRKVPKYLRDLKDGLLETQDCEVFTQSVQVCQNLITQQLPDDDASLGIELLQILLALEQRFFVDNFDACVFRSCVAIACIYPAQSAEFLCQEFHADVGTYSISHRILILDVLSEAAETLSSLKPEKETKSIVVKKKKSRELESAEEVIRKRLEAKTRYFHSHKSFRVEQLNKFAHVASYFFFPLLYGYGRNKMISQMPQDNDFILLVHFIRALTIVLCSAQNCPAEPRMAKEILHFSWYLRFHKDVKVRMSVISLIGAAVLNTPNAILVSDFIDELLEFRLWLGDLLSLNVARGEPNVECRTLAASAMCIIDSVLKVDE